MDLGLGGKTALVFGAGGGLGGAIARTLAREGATVALADIDDNAAHLTAEAIRAEGGEARVHHWDLRDLDHIEDRFAAVEAVGGPVDVLINNTGGPAPTPAADQDMSMWMDGFQSMVLSVIKITDAALPGMRRRGWGRIITSASSGVVAPIPNLGLSNALRMSLVGWSKTLAREVARDGITCNVVVPGRIATPRIRFLDARKAEREGRPLEAVLSDSAASIPMGRLGDPEEYAAMVAFLAGVRASYVTGSVIRVDGGLIPSV